MNLDEYEKNLVTGAAGSTQGGNAAAPAQRSVEPFVRTSENDGGAMSYLGRVMSNPEEENKKQKRAYNHGAIIALGDALRNIGNIYNTSRYGSPQKFNDPSSALYAEEKKRRLKVKENDILAAKELREAARDEQKRRQWLADHELKKQDAARKAKADERAARKAQRDEELHPYAVRERSARANKAESDAITAGVKAQDAPNEVKRKQEAHNATMAQKKASTAATYNRMKNDTLRTRKYLSGGGGKKSKKDSEKSVTTKHNTFVFKGEDWDDSVTSLYNLAEDQKLFPKWERPKDVKGMAKKLRELDLSQAPLDRLPDSIKKNWNVEDGGWLDYDDSYDYDEDEFDLNEEEDDDEFDLN